MAEQIYRYKAFISYRHVDPDRRWAKWLIDNLETFRTPRPLLAHGVPSHIGHLFRDDEEIPASSNLSNQIEEALKASQYLIVVCSPNTPKSQWCRHEIDYFRKLGKGDRILALLIEGEPDEAFPPELLHVPYEVTHADGSKTIEMRDEEPIASDVRPRADESKHVTERRALIRIAATLLGVSFDDLAQRDHQRAVHRQRIIGSAIAAAALLVAGIGGWYWDYTRVKTAYYAELGFRNDEPLGIGKISHADSTHRWATYEIQSQRGHVIHVRRINGAGALRGLKGDEIDSDPWNAFAAEWQIAYASDSGKVGTIRVSDENGRPLRIENYVDLPNGGGRVVQFLRKDATTMPLPSEVTVFQTRTGLGSVRRQPDVSQHRLFYTADGFVARRRFETGWGQPARDRNGDAGRVYTYSPDGLILTVGAVSSAGTPLPSKDGALMERRSYDASGNLSRFAMVDDRGALVSGTDFGRDGLGNIVSRRSFGRGGRPTLSANGFTVEHDAYDDHGNLVRVSFFDENGVAMPNKHGYAQFTNGFNALGRPVRIDYYNPRGRRTLDDQGIASAEQTFDAQGNVIRLKIFGVNGKPVIGKGGYAIRETSYDPAGNAVEYRYFDGDGHLSLNADGLAVMRARYDIYGNDVEEWYFDTHRQLIESDGYARVTTDYDVHGNFVLQQFHDRLGHLAISKSLGLAGKRLFYNEQGYWSRVDYLGTDGGPMLNGGAASLIVKYDDRGNLTDQSYEGLQGERVVGPDGFCHLKLTYDASDNAVHLAYFDTSDRPTLAAAGYAALQVVYDKLGNAIETNYLGIDGKPVNTKSGFARDEQTFDGNGRVTAHRFFDVNGNLDTMPGVPAIMTRSYDRRGNLTQLAYFDAMRRPMINPAQGFARAVFVYDARSRTLEDAYYGADGKLLFLPALGYARRVVEADDVGNLTDIKYYGADGKLLGRPGTGVAHVHSEVAADGTVARTLYYNAQDRLILALPLPPHRSK